jgi:hypothetical protein
LILLKKSFYIKRLDIWVQSAIIAIQIEKRSKNMKTALIVLSLSVLVACSPADDRARDSAGRIEKILPEVCLNGVVYYTNYNGYHTSYTPKFKPDSTVETCE